MGERRPCVLLYYAPWSGLLETWLVGVSPSFISPSEGNNTRNFLMPDTVFDPQADDQQLLAQVVDHYHRTLTESTEGLNDLIGRGIANRESIDHFRIGLVDYSLAKRLPSPQRIAGKTIRVLGCEGWV